MRFRKQQESPAFCQIHVTRMHLDGCWFVALTCDVHVPACAGFCSADCSASLIPRLLWTGLISLFVFSGMWVVMAGLQCPVSTGYSCWSWWHCRALAKWHCSHSAVTEAEEGQQCWGGAAMLSRAAASAGSRGAVGCAEDTGAQQSWGWMHSLGAVPCWVPCRARLCSAQPVGWNCCVWGQFLWCTNPLWISWDSLTQVTQVIELSSNSAFQTLSTWGEF